MHRGRVIQTVTLAVAALSLGLATAAPVAGTTAAPGADWLWLAPPTPLAPLPNFTADPPTPPELVAVAPGPIQAGSAEIVWKWVMPNVPAPWHVPNGTTFSAELVFAGIDRVVPIVDLDSEAARLGRLEVRIDILHLSSDDGIATGAQYLSPALPGTDASRTVHIDATTTRDAHYGANPGDAPLFGLKVTLTGFAQNDDPPVLLIGHPDQSARLGAPGFPLDALRDWNEHDTADAACNQRVLQRLPCDDEVAKRPPVPQGGTAPVAHVEEAAAPGVVGVAALLAGLVAVVGHARRSRSRQ